MADGENMRVTEEGVVWEESSRGKKAPPSPPLPLPPPPPKEENKESLLPQKRRKIKETTHSNRESEGMMGLSPTTRKGCGNHYSSEESALDHDPSLMSGGHNSNRRSASESPALASGTQHSESSSAAACFRWPPSSWLHGTAEERSAYFSGLQKRLVSDIEQRQPSGQQATTLLDLMTIRAFHSKVLRRFSLGTAVGFRTRRGLLTNIPAIIVFVARKVHKEWLDQIQRLPTILEGPGGIWCDVDVVEFSCYGASAPTHKEQVYTELVEGLRGNDPFIGPGSQVASQETYGTLGAIVQSRTGARQVGFLTNRHVAVNLDYPNQKMFHPLPPNLGPGVYLGAVERATSFITDDLWYGIFASTNSETFVRADGAFIPFADYFDISKVTTSVKEVGETGDVVVVDLQAAIGSIVGKRVAKVGRSSGLTTGSIMAYALEYNDEKGICVFTDFLIVGENGQTFDLEGDSGSLILMMGENGEKPKPIGIIWGGTSNRGRLRLRNGHAPENWTSGVDLCRLLDLLQLALITNDAALEEAIEEQRRWSTGLAMGSTVGESSPGGGGGPLLELDMEMPEGGRRPTLVVEEEIPSFIPVDARSQHEEGDFGHNNSEREELVSGLGHNCSEREELASGLGHNNSELGLNLGGEAALASSSAALPMVELELMEFGFRLPPPTNNPKEAESGVFDAPADEDREDLSIRLNSFDNNREGKRLWPLEP